MYHRLDHIWPEYDHPEITNLYGRDYDQPGILLFAKYEISSLPRESLKNFRHVSLSSNSSHSFVRFPIPRNNVRQIER